MDRSKSKNVYLSEEESDEKNDFDVKLSVNLKRKLQDSETINDLDNKYAKYDPKALKMMKNMGYKAGHGLGLKGRGRADIIEQSQQRGRKGLGVQIHKKLQLNENATWDFTDEEAAVDEHVVWFSSNNKSLPNSEYMRLNWMIEDKAKKSIDDENEFVDVDILEAVLNYKSVFDDLDEEEMRQARMRSNPYESILKGIFQNRAAMKMANMDSVLDFMFSKPKTPNSQHCLVKSDEPLYFADICSGPGGFSEYILWRSVWSFKGFCKGFGFTLKNGENDFKLHEFRAGSQEMFEPHYGVNDINGDGDIYKSNNQQVFKNFVLNCTKNRGVHFVMGDGGFSVEGEENIQEILSKRLYLCQFSVALSILRPGGSFVCKLFDIFTKFSVSLIYLMSRAFDRISIYKPVTSRPANSERYIVCQWLKSDGNITEIYNYMCIINETLENLIGSSNSIEEIVPLQLIKEDKEFFNYIKNSNNDLGAKQQKALDKIRIFAQNKSLFDNRQPDVKQACLNAWNVPDEKRPTIFRPNGFSDVLSQTLKCCSLENKQLIINQPNYLSCYVIEKLLTNSFNWRCFPVCSNKIVFLISGGRNFVYEMSTYNDPGTRKVEKLNLPKNSIVCGYFCQEIKGESRGQRKRDAFHIVDALILCGQSICNYHFNDRVKKIEIFCSCIEMKTRSDLIVIRPPKLYRTEDISSVFKPITWLKIKNLNIEKPCIPENDDGYFGIFRGIIFVNTMKDPWIMAWSKTNRRKYFFNKVENVSSYDIKQNMFLSAELSLQKLAFYDFENIPTKENFEIEELKIINSIAAITPNTK